MEHGEKYGYHNVYTYYASGGQASQVPMDLTENDSSICGRYWLPCQDGDLNGITVTYGERRRCWVIYYFDEKYCYDAS